MWQHRIAKAEIIAPESMGTAQTPFSGAMMAAAFYSRRPLGINLGHMGRRRPIDHSFGLEGAVDGGRDSGAGSSGQ